MGWYAERLFPAVADRVLGRPALGALRAALLAAARGRTLDFGAGTGLNLPLYPPAVTRVTAFDVNPGMARRASARVGACPAPAEYRTAPPDAWPFADASFDTVVSTWTLCTVPDPAAALRRLARALKPGGCFLFLEHGLGRHAGLRLWQRRLSPLWSRLACGCRIDRDVRAALEGAPGLELEEIEEFAFAPYPPPWGWFTAGRARRQRDAS